MKFSDVIGQHDATHKLIQSVKDGRISHAQMFWGPPGIGKLALALAYAQYLNCTNKTENDSCGSCPSCVKASRLTHPDIHFIYPTTTTKKIKKDPESRLFAEEWRSFVLEHNAYLRLNDWYDYLGVENKQGVIYARDATEITRILSLKAYEGIYRVIIIWMVEKLHNTAANKLLKLLEEPPENTVFILLSEETEQVLTTIKSRTYQIKIPRIDTEELQNTLAEKYHQRIADVSDAAVMADGSLPEAIRLYENAEDEKHNFVQFQQWMRLCFKSNVPELIDFSANISTTGREKQKSFLSYALHLFRNSLLQNHALFDYLRLSADEVAFNKNFAPFVHHDNILQLVEITEEGIRQIERNANAQILFLDISFKITKLLRQKPSTV